jgi:hypothetical protein
MINEYRLVALHGRNFRTHTPVPDQARLDVLGAQRFAQQRVVQQVDLPTGRWFAARQ